MLPLVGLVEPLLLFNFVMVGLDDLTLVLASLIVSTVLRPPGASGQFTAYLEKVLRKVWGMAELPWSTITQ